MDIDSMLQSFINKKLLIIGDMMLDTYVWGDVHRISLEAPVPVVRVRKKTFALGGTGNVAATVSTLNAQAVMIGLVGEDPEAEKLKELLQEYHVLTDHIIGDKTRVTTKKTRVLARNQNMIRLDYETYAPPSAAIMDNIRKLLDQLVPESDIIVVSDRGKGLVTRELMYIITKSAEEHKKKVIVDPFPKHKDYYVGASIVTPNESEAQKMTGLVNVDLHNFERMGEILTEYFNAHVLLRRNLKGMDFFNMHGSMTHIASSLKEVVDITGTRDVVLAVLALSIAAGATTRDALKICSAAADITMSRVGTYTPTIAEIRESMMHVMYPD